MSPPKNRYRNHAGETVDPGSHLWTSPFQPVPADDHSGLRAETVLTTTSLAMAAGPMGSPGRCTPGGKKGGVMVPQLRRNGKIHASLQEQERWSESRT